MQRRLSRNVSTPINVLLTIGLAACATASRAQDRDTCVTGQVPEAFTLPDGSEHPAGPITLCTLQALSPVVGLHRVWVNDTGASFATSRRFRPEAATGDDPVLLFYRVSGAPLDLVGYVVPFAQKSWGYTLNRSPRAGSTERAKSPAPRPPGELVSVLASRGSMLRGR